MKNIILILIFAVTLVSLNSCSKIDEHDSAVSSVAEDGYFEYNNGMWTDMMYRIEEKVIDSCEYIIIFGPGDRDLVHKANCNNPEHLPVVKSKRNL